MQNKSDITWEKIELFQLCIDYPYVASEQRSNIILNNISKLKEEMRLDDVIGLLTNPDEVNLTYKNIKINKKEDSVTGFSLVYLLERFVENGSVNEKKERLVRIHFNKSNKLISSYSINIDGFKEGE